MPASVIEEGGPQHEPKAYFHQRATVGTKPTVRIPVVKDGMLDIMQWTNLVAETQENNKQAPLLQLPRELRDKSYDFYFADLQATVLRTGTILRHRKRPINNQHPLALLLSCRLLYAEARLRIFTDARFAFSGSLSTMEARLLPAQAQAITTIAGYDFFRGGDLHVLDLAARLSALKRILVCPHWPVLRNVSVDESEKRFVESVRDRFGEKLEILVMNS